MKKFLYFLFLLPYFLFAQAPAGYYDAANGLTGYALKTKLSEIIAKSYSYHYNDLRDYYLLTDLDQYYDHGTENTTLLLDIYTEKPNGTEIEYTRSDLQGGSQSITAEGQAWNREHMIPSSFFREDGREQYPMYSDLFTVIPVDAWINQRRSNFMYGNVQSVSATYSNGSKLGSTGGRTYYEPIDEFKGDVARSLLYFAVRYESKQDEFQSSLSGTAMEGSETRVFSKDYIDMLISWHNLDPVSVRERDRNNAVYNLQKNRNPFIDKQEYVAMIWNQTTDAIAPAAPLNLSVARNSAFFADISWTASPDPDVVRYIVRQNGNYVGQTSGTSFSVDHLNPSTSYTFTVTAVDNGNNESAASNPLSVTTMATDLYAKDLMISKYIEGSANNKAIEVVNKTGHDVNLDTYVISIQLNAGGNYYTGDQFQLQGVLKHGETAVVMHPEFALGCYAPAEARFVTNSPAMTYAGSQYVELAYRTETVDAVGIKGINNSTTNQDTSLYRLASVNQPTVNFTSAEWERKGLNTCEELGTSVLANDEVEIYGNDIKVYPNPVTQGILFADGKNIAQISEASIFDMSGRLVRTEAKPFRAKNSIDVSPLKAGVYILKLDGHVYRFIKK